MRKFLVLFVLLIIATSAQLHAQNFSNEEVAGWQKRAQQITIIRDKWGSPHIYGKTDADAVFGLLYAQCEDDFDRVEMNYITSLGRLAEVEGEKELYTDLRTRFYADTIRAIQLYKDSPLDMKKLMDAFADGVNFYLHKHPEVKPRLLHRFKPWYPLLFSEGSIGGNLTRISTNKLTAFYEKERAASETDEIPEPKGSNGFAIAPSKSATGNALLLINPHTSFYFRCEVHVVSEEGLNAYGAVTWGQFFIYQGFNEHCGWMHTSSYADVVDEYEETIERKNGSILYKYDDGWKEVQSKTVELAYKTEEGVKEKKLTVYQTHHGPVVSSEGDKWVAVKMMDDPLTALTQSFVRTKSKGYKDYKKAMDLKANASNNTVFADNEGNIAYWHGNFIPKRDTQFDWSHPVDGSNPATEWKGLHSVDEIVSILNPSNGWIQNCNSTPFTAVAENSPQMKNYPSYMAPDGQNFRGVNAVRVLERESSFTLDKLIAAAYDPKLTAFEKLIPSLTGAFNSSDNNATKASLSEPISVLKSWDMNYSVSSVAQTLAMYWGKRMQQFAMPRLPADFTTEQRTDVVFLVDFMINKTTAQEKLNALIEALEELNRDFGTWNIPWGEVNRYQRLTGKMEETFDDNKPSIPVASTSSFWGTLAAYGSRTYPGTKKMYGYVGNSFVAVVEFGKRIKAKSLLTGGQSSHPSSPHFTDQVEMYCKGQFKDVFFYKEDVVKNSEQTYHPGN